MGWTLAPIVLALALPAGEAAVCSFCDGRGTRPCSAHGAADVALESNATFCSVAVACDSCSGTFAVDCEKCAIGDSAHAAAVAVKRKWWAGTEAHRKRFDHEFAIGQSRHFELSWSGGKLMVEKRLLSEHAAMHEYLDRLEALYQDFCATLGCGDDDFSTRFRVMVWSRFMHHQIAATQYTAQPNPNTGTKRMGAVGIYSVFLDPNQVDPDESASQDLHRNIRHNVAHLLLANVWNARWPGELQGGGWLDEGVAHVFEDRLDQRCTNFCYREQDTTQTFKGGRWREPVKKLAAARDRLKFADVAQKRSEELTLQEHALAWSWCDCLIAKDGPAFGRLCRAVKDGKGYRDALKDGYGFSAPAFEEAWQKYAKAYKK